MKILTLLLFFNIHTFYVIKEKQTQGDKHLYKCIRTRFMAIQDTVYILNNKNYNLNDTLY